MEKLNFLHLFGRNGWEFVAHDLDESGDEYIQYRTKFLGRCYHSIITAVVSEGPKHLSLDGHYGILWLQAKYECDAPYTWGDLEDMQEAIIAAEENLLKIGIPFTKDYEFHGKNVANKIRRNKALRYKFNLVELENKGFMELAGK